MFGCGEYEGCCRVVLGVAATHTSRPMRLMTRSFGGCWRGWMMILTRDTAYYVRGRSKLIYRIEPRYTIIVNDER
jgi:hypothetical protein